MKRIFGLLLAVAGCALSTGAIAQEAFPSKPIRIVVPLAPGGATDTVARIVARHLGERLNTSVVVENRTGAGGLIALESMSRAPADGYTLFVGNVSTNALTEVVQAAKLKGKPSEWLMPITMLATIPHVLVSSANFAPTSVAEAIRHAKSHPGKVNHASPGVGSYSMLDMLRFERAAGLDMFHVPYNGGAGQFLAPLVSGEVHLAFVNVSSVIGMVNNGRLRALATTSDKRLAELPAVPTMSEVGYGGIGTNAWQGIFVPRATPAPVVKRLFDAIAEVLKLQDVHQSFGKTLIVAAPSESPEQFDAFVRKEVAEWGQIVKELGVKVE